MDDLEWAHMFQRRCRAVKEPPGCSLAYGRVGEFFGRCELRCGHAGYHALERGFDILYWSTEWTA